MIWLGSAPCLGAKRTNTHLAETFSPAFLLDSKPASNAYWCVGTSEYNSKEPGDPQAGIAVQIVLPESLVPDLGDDPSEGLPSVGTARFDRLSEKETPEQMDWWRS